MSVVDTIIYNSKNNNYQNFDKQKWVKEQQEKRSKAYELIDKTAKDIVADESKYKTYLDVQSNFDLYSVGNGLLITAQKPNATQIKSFADWNKLGNVYKNHKKIVILEPGNEYQRKDGSIGVYYNPKDMIDISDTSVKTVTNDINFDDSIKLSALISNCPVDIKTVDDIGIPDKIANWSKEDNTLYVQRNDSPKETFKEIATELSKATLESTGDEELDNFKSESISYMICKKYNIETSDKINNIPNSLKNMESKEIRSELNAMKNVMDEMNSRMGVYFEKQFRQKERSRDR